MRKVIGAWTGLVLLCLLAAAPSLTQARAPIDPRIFEQMGTNPTGEATFLVVLSARPQLDGLPPAPDRLARRERTVNLLKATAARSQAPVLHRLTQLHAQGLVRAFQGFFSTNVVSVTGGQPAVSTLAALPGVDALEADTPVQVQGWLVGGARPADADVGILAVQSNIRQVQAPAAWALGFRGQGVVVAGIDTGVRHTHAALVRNYRCGRDGPHRTCWLDAVAGERVPYDDHFHGTHTMGTAVGRLGPGHRGGQKRQVDRLQGDGRGREGHAHRHPGVLRLPAGPAGALHAGYDQQLLGRSPRQHGLYRPDRCLAGRRDHPGLLGGNAGPACGSTSSPGEYTRAFAAGAVDREDLIAPFSSRGPASPENGGSIKPDVVAPGVSIRSATHLCDSCYGLASGTSMAAPHVTGVVALVLSKNPTLAPGRQRVIVERSARAIQDLTCGGRPSDYNVYGWGRIDALRAVNATPAVLP